VVISAGVRYRRGWKAEGRIVTLFLQGSVRREQTLASRSCVQHPSGPRRTGGMSSGPGARCALRVGTAALAVAEDPAMGLTTTIFMR
jgi:hypothetical protein